MSIPFLSAKGMTATDPLDKAPANKRVMMVAGVNLLLTVIVVFLLRSVFKTVEYQSFPFFGQRLPVWATMAVLVLFNSAVLSPLLIPMRKAASLYPFLLVFLPYFLLDLFFDGHYRSAGRPESALWNYSHSSFLEAIDPPVVRFVLANALMAFFIGVVSLFVARVLAAAFYANKAYPVQATREQYDGLFRADWSAESLAKPGRDAAFWVLRLLGFGYLLYLCVLIVGLLGAAAWPKGAAGLIEMTYRNPALAIHTYFKIGLMVMLTFLAAYNRQLRFFACAGLLVGHAISTVYALTFYFIESLGASDKSFLLASAIVDGVMIGIFAWIMIRYKKDSEVFAPENNMPRHFSTPLSLQNTLYGVIAIAFAAIAAGIVLVRLLGEGLRGTGAVFGYPDPMIGNTVTLYGTLALLTFLQVKRQKLRPYFFNTLVVPLLFGGIVALLWIIIGGRHGGVTIETRHQTAVQADWFFVLFAVFAFLLSYALMAVRQLVFKIDFAINTLSPSAALNAMAVANTFFNADTRSQAAVLKSIDQFAGGITGRRRGLLNIPFDLFENVLNFLYGFHPPFSTMSSEEQRYFLRKYFLRPADERQAASFPPFADLAYNIGQALNSLVSFAYYSNTTTRHEVGFVPVDARDRIQGSDALYPPPHRTTTPLPKDHLDSANFYTPAAEKLVAPRVTTPVGEAAIPAEVDYLIIGSGAGGAVMAYRLACDVANPEGILVVERGQRYQPLQDVLDNEIEMIKKVYKDGGLQQTKRGLMTVLQGECVGGTTVINNAVCLKMPDGVKAEWQQHYGIDLGGLEAEYERVQAEINIQPLGEKGVNTRVKARFLQGVDGYNAAASADEKLEKEERLTVNHMNTLGDGSWNLGNRRQRKRSMLETYLPWAEARGAKVVSNMTAMRFFASNSGVVESVVLRSSAGQLYTVRVKKAVIVAGGVISSSHFLLRSEAGKNLPVGRRMSCNFAFPVTVEFEEELRAYDGDQITLAALDPKHRAAFETYFNPPASFALSSMPFFFERREQIMKRYTRLVNFGALMGSEPNGYILPKANPLTGQAFEWTLGKTDLENIRYSFKTLVELSFYAGATRAVLPTKPGLDIPLTKKAVQEFANAFDKYPLQMADMYIGTAHPQGGNGMGGKDYPAKVVNEDYRVEGYQNLYVADASIFPTSLTVNPQWTILSLSSIASQKVLERHESTIRVTTPDAVNVL